MQYRKGKDLVSNSRKVTSSCKFSVGQKSLRDHLKLLMQKYKPKMRMEEGASGIYTEMTEIDVILEEFVR